MILAIAGIPFWFPPLRYGFESFPWFNVFTRITYSRIYWLTVIIWAVWVVLSVTDSKKAFEYVNKKILVLDKKTESAIEKFKKPSIRLLAYSFIFLVISFIYVIFTNKTEGFFKTILVVAILWIEIAIIYYFIKFIAQMFVQGTILNLVIFLGICSIVFFTIIELKADTFGIRVSVPNKFQKDNPGFNSDVFARKIGDEVLKINQKAAWLDKDILKGLSPSNSGVYIKSPVKIRLLPKPKIQVTDRSFTFDDLKNGLYLNLLVNNLILNIKSKEYIQDIIDSPYSMIDGDLVWSNYKNKWIFSVRVSINKKIISRDFDWIGDETFREIAKYFISNLDVIQLALVNYSVGGLESAIELTNTHIEQNPGDLYALNQGIIYFSMYGEFERSKEIFHISRKYFYINPEIYNAISIAYLINGNKEKSVEYLGRALNISQREKMLTKNRHLFLNRSLVQYINGNKSAAKLDYAKFKAFANKEELAVTKNFAVLINANTGNLKIFSSLFN